jgi:signal transduction histidine kinase
MSDASGTHPPYEDDVPSVLVVDDAPANLIALEVVLEPLPIRVVEARSGPEALARVAEASFAVVLLDVQMPDMDGFEVARRIRRTENGRELPILFLTAVHHNDSYAREGYASGAADYITKPFDPEVLRARVKAFVDLYRQREKLRRAQVGERTRERDEALAKLGQLLESERIARREAEIANQAKDQFLATVSHELRTPLNAILGWTTIAQHYPASPQLRRALETIERNARAQLRIVEDILDVDRISSGKLRLELTSASVADVVEAAVVAVQPAADAKSVEIALAIEVGMAPIVADADRLQQIVWNVLSNAIKFTPRDGHVEVSVARVDGDVVIRVKDDGEGIAAEFLPCLFDAFRQADGSTTRRHGGLGLGLTIARQLVHAHGGRISASSEGHGMGSTFTIELPARPPAPVAVALVR